MPRRSYDGWGEFKPRIPADGIRAKSQRGAFGSSWWAKRWIGVLEGFGWGSRLTRGRSYARNGSVLDMTIASGEVTARVQGSSPRPYKVSIGIKPLTDAQWDNASDAMAQEAIFAAKLLAGEMPQEIEQAFQAAKVPLFPQSARDLVTDCSCPDYANPCKHIAAVYYLLGERFDEDPFLLFALRGRTQQQIMAALRARRGATEETAFEAQPSEPVPALADALDHYYAAGDALDQITPQIAAPAIEAAILRRYGAAPGGVEAELRAVYAAMTRGALERVFGQNKD
jgi:uncharacterized Zn finger protein